MSKPTRITTGFLTGNFDQSIDPDQTAANWERALAVVFPDAKIEVRYQHGSGCLPHGLQTFVELYDAVEYESEGLSYGWCERVRRVLENVEPAWLERSHD